MKELPTIAQIQAITDQYDPCKLECDGMTNVLHFYLWEADISHAVYEGCVTTKAGGSFGWHRWIRLETQEGDVTIDYRARMWLGNDEAIPHGIFFEKDYPFVTYHGKETYLPLLPKYVIKFMIED